MRYTPPLTCANIYIQPLCRPCVLFGLELLVHLQWVGWFHTEQDAKAAIQKGDMSDKMSKPKKVVVCWYGVVWCFVLCFICNLSLCAHSTILFPTCRQIKALHQKWSKEEDRRLLADGECRVVERGLGAGERAGQM